MCCLYGLLEEKKLLKRGEVNDLIFEKLYDERKEELNCSKVILIVRAQKSNQLKSGTNIGVRFDAY